MDAATHVAEDSGTGDLAQGHTVVLRSSPRSEVLILFTFREDAHWNADRQAVEFGVKIGVLGWSGSP